MVALRATGPKDSAGLHVRVNFTTGAEPGSTAADSVNGLSLGANDLVMGNVVRVDSAAILAPWGILGVVTHGCGW